MTDYCTKKREKKDSNNRMYYGIALYLLQSRQSLAKFIGTCFEVFWIANVQPLTQIKCLLPYTVFKNGKLDGNLQNQERKPRAYISYLLKYNALVKYKLQSVLNPLCFPGKNLTSDQRIGYIISITEGIQKVYYGKHLAKQSNGH